MSAKLIEQLKQVEDFRTRDGRRHPLWLVLLLVILGTMNGAVGYRALGDFVKRHQRGLIETFGTQKHGVPSYSTLRRVILGTDFEQLAQRFNAWAQGYVALAPSEWCATDGKSIRGTVENAASPQQNFVSLVSIFTSKRKLVIGIDPFENKKESEIQVVQDLISVLQREEMVLSFDSLHCQKKLAS